MKDFLTDEVRKERLRNLQKHQLSIQEKIRKELVGKTMRVLVDGRSNMKGIKKWKGRTNCNRIVHFIPDLPEKNYLWHWVDLKIISSTSLSCNGNLITDFGRIPPR